MPQHPRNRHFARGPSVPRADTPQHLHQRQVLRQPRLLELHVVAPPIGCRQRIDPLARHRPGEQSRQHRRVDEHANVVLLAVRQQLALDIAPEQRVRRLQARHRRNRPGGLEVGDREVRHADVPQLARLLQVCERAPGLLDAARTRLLLHRPARPVHLIQVDALHLEPAEAVVHLLANRHRGEVVPHRARVVPHEAALGEHQRTLPDGNVTQRARDDLLRMAESVGGRGVDPVHAARHCLPNRRNRLVIVLRAPAETPLAAYGPGAESDGGDVEVGVSELTGMHGYRLQASGYHRLQAAGCHRPEDAWSSRHQT